MAPIDPNLRNGLATAREKGRMICRECRQRGEIVETREDFITQTYTRRGSDVTVVVEGIPAEVCPVCGETYINLEIAKQIDLFVHPLLEFGRGKHTLSMPRVKVELKSKLAQVA